MPDSVIPTQLTYPISTEYVERSWTVERALAELIANALDEDPAATAVWQDGVLTISDAGPGIPEEGLILGYSPKGDTQIGQFGEGAKLGALVLARDPSVGAVRIDTVGYAIVPSVESRRVLDGLVPRRSESAPEVLVYSFYPSQRTHGTVVTVECAKKVADAAIARFRHLAEPGYTPPTDRAEVLLTGRRGRLYIGGLLVSTNPRLRASYDFPLAQAKTAQNRDRSVIAAETLTTLVSAALAATADEAIMAHFVDAALAGRQFAEAERYFQQVSDPRVRAAYRRHGQARFAGRDVYWCQPGVDVEAILELEDGNHELVTARGLDERSHAALMELLGVPEVRAARQQARERNTESTTYIARSRLTASERQHLESAITRVKATFGRDALDEVRVYTETDRSLACADGFYTPSPKGPVSVARHVLTSAAETLSVLVHESAHRIAHRRGAEYGDRTRGFEHQLEQMVVHLMLTATRDVAAPGAADVAVPDPDGQVAAFAPIPTPIPPSRVALADLLAEVADPAAEAAGHSSAAKLVAAVGLHVQHYRLLRNPRPAGYRTNTYSSDVSMVSDYRKHQVLGEAFGITPAVLWCGHMVCEGPRYRRTKTQTDTSGWSRKLRVEVDQVAADLDALGGPYVTAAGRLRALAAGDEASPLDDTGWEQWVVDLIDAERTRMGLDVAA